MQRVETRLSESLIHIMGGCRFWTVRQYTYQACQSFWHHVKSLFCHFNVRGFFLLWFTSAKVISLLDLYYILNCFLRLQIALCYFLMLCFNCFFSFVLEFIQGLIIFEALSHYTFIGFFASLFWKLLCLSFQRGQGI